MATLASSVIGPTTRIERSDIVLQGPMLAPKYTDDGAIKLVERDTERAETFLNNKQWNIHWREADVLYQSPRTFATFENSVVTRANTSRFTVAKHVNSLAPMMRSGIFYERPPFVIRPRPATKQATAVAKSALYGALLDKIDFEQTCNRGIENQILFGTVVFKGGWETKTKKVKRFTRKKPPIEVTLPFQQKPVKVNTKESDEFQIEDDEVTTNQPFFEECALGEVLPDPGWRHANRLDKAKYVIHRTYPTFKDLDELRLNDSYDSPSEEDLVAYFFSHENAANAPSSVEDLQGDVSELHHAEPRNKITSDDPLERPIEMLERWDATYVYTILRTADRASVIIRNEEHGLGRIPFFSANYWNIPNAGWGLGVGRLVGTDQRIEKGLMDSVLDILSYALNPQYARDRGANVPTQQIRTRLGGIVDVEANGKNPRDAFGIIETPKVPPEVFAVLQNAQTNAQSTSGADEAFTQGSLPGKGGSSAARTATGAGGIMAANAGKISGPVGNFASGVMLPFLDMMQDMVQERMPITEIREILGDEMAADFELDELDFFNSVDKFEILAGAHLAAKKAMAQALPMIVQIFENPALTQQLNAMGYKIDVLVLLKMFMEMSEWKDQRDLIVPMNPQEAQNFQQSNPGMQKMQGALAQIQAKHAAKTEEIDQQAEAKTGRDVLLNAFQDAGNYVARQNDREEFREGAFQ